MGFIGNRYKDNRQISSIVGALGRPVASKPYVIEKIEKTRKSFLNNSVAVYTSCGFNKNILVMNDLAKEKRSMLILNYTG